MPQIDTFTKKNRSKEVRAACEKNSKFWLDSQIGNNAEVLIEDGNSGYSEHYAKVTVEDSELPGSIKKIKILGRRGLTLFGKTIQNQMK